MSNQAGEQKTMEPEKVVTVEQTSSTNPSQPSSNGQQQVKESILSNPTEIKPTENTTPSQATSPDVPTVVSYRKITVDENTIDCEYTYSDGTTKQFHWQVTNPTGAWQEDGMGQNGHPTSVVIVTGVCDDSIIGTPKY